MVERKRAMVLGKFRFIDLESGRDFEEMSAFKATVARHSVRSVPYAPRPIGFKTVPRYAKTNTRFAVFKAQFPGIGDRFSVAWTSPRGDIHIDAKVKLYDMRSVQVHCLDYDSRGPKSGWFGLVDPRVAPTPDDTVQFDANMFWTVGLLYKYYGTSGVEDWDIEIAEMVNTHTLAESAAAAAGSTVASAASVGGPIHHHQRQQLMPTPLHSYAGLNTSRLGAGVHLAPPPAAAAPLVVATPTIKPLMAIPPPRLPPLVTSSSSSSFLTSSSSSSFVTSPAAATAGAKLEHAVNNNERYNGCVVEWRGTYGFVSCNFIPTRVFLHSSEIRDGWSSTDQDLPVGTSVNFAIAHDPAKGYKAVSAQLYT